MITVYKYQLDLNSVINVMMPQGAEVLMVATQRGQPCLWARVDTDKPMESVAFYLCGTGHPGAVGKHVGSFLVQDGAFVFHLFRRGGE